MNWNISDVFTKIQIISLFHHARFTRYKTLIVRHAQRFKGKRSRVNVNTKYKLRKIKVKRIHFSEESRLDLGPTQLSIQCITAGICLGVKQMGHEGQHPSSSSSKVKHERYITLVNTYSACREKKTVIYGWWTRKNCAEISNLNSSSSITLNK